MKLVLTERLRKFAKDLVIVAQSMTLNTINRNSVEKCVECGTNAGAEYALASNASTKKAFTLKINMCKQQLCACAFRLELLVETMRQEQHAKLKKDLHVLFLECKELEVIFRKISYKLIENVE